MAKNQVQDKITGLSSHILGNNIIKLLILSKTNPNNDTDAFLQISNFYQSFDFFPNS